MYNQKENVRSNFPNQKYEPDPTFLLQINAIIHNPETCLTRTTQLAELPLSSAIHSVPAPSWVTHVCFKGFHAVEPEIRIVSGLCRQLILTTARWHFPPRKWYPLKRELSLILFRDFMPFKITPLEHPISQFHGHLGWLLFERLSSPYLKLLHTQANLPGVQSTHRVVCRGYRDGLVCKDKLVTRRHLSVACDQHASP